MNPIGRKGEWVLCDNCRKPYVQLARDVYWGEMITAEMFEPREDIVNGGPYPVCSHCGERPLRMHTFGPGVTT